MSVEFWAERVRDVLSLGRASVRLTPLTTGKFNTSYRASWDGGEALLRIAPADDVGQLFYERRMMRQEPALHATLLGRTSIPAPRILAFDASRRHAPRDHILMEWLPGRALSERPDAGRLEDRAFADVGRFLAEAHAIEADEHGYVGDHRPMAPAPTWREAFEMMWNLLLDDVAATGVVEDAEIDRWRRAFERRRELFDTERPARLLHMDVWHQNILTDDNGAVTGLVDWDRALWGDPEIEFAVLDYCGVSTPAFWSGYGRQRDTSPEARERWVFYYLYELLKYIPIRVWRGGGSGTGRYLDAARRIAAPWADD